MSLSCARSFAQFEREATGERRFLRVLMDWQLGGHDGAPLNLATAFPIMEVWSALIGADQT